MIAFYNGRCLLFLFLLLCKALDDETGKEKEKEKKHKILSFEISLLFLLL